MNLLQKWPLHSLPCLLTLLLLAPATRSLAEIPAEFDRYMVDTMAEWRVPGMLVSVVKDDAVVMTRGFGLRRFGEPEEVDADTLFSIGSTSKAFAAATVAVLVSDGLIDWDDRVSQYLPWLELYDPEVTAQFTVRDMLSGTLGAFYADENKLRSKVKDSREILDRGKYIEPRAPFRSGFIYTNNMFIASGELVEAVSGKTWPDFARERLWLPLGMTSTGASAEAAWASGNAASGHVKALFSSKPKPTPYSYCDEICVPSGGVNTNAKDVANWLRFQLGDGSFAGKGLIAPEPFAEMHRPQSLMHLLDDDSAFGIYTPFPTRDAERWGFASPAYGFGWGLFEYRGQQALWHSGGANNTSSVAILVPELSLGIFVSANRSTSDITKIVSLHLLDAYLGGNEVNWSEKFAAKD
ncbi:MAG: serine hydrolase domain-containing protein [Pseudomonadota bacterium]